jgi:hypothetical protein
MCGLDWRMPRDDTSSFTLGAANPYPPLIVWRLCLTQAFPVCILSGKCFQSNQKVQPFHEIRRILLRTMVLTSRTEFTATRPVNVVLFLQKRAGVFAFPRS